MLESVSPEAGLRTIAGLKGKPIVLFGVLESVSPEAGLRTIVNDCLWAAVMWAWDTSSSEMHIDHSHVAVGGSGLGVEPRFGSDQSNVCSLQVSYCTLSFLHAAESACKGGGGLGILPLWA